VQILVEVDLDPVPGAGATPESWQRIIEQKMGEDWYHPSVSVVGVVGENGSRGLGTDQISDEAVEAAAIALFDDDHRFDVESWDWHADLSNSGRAEFRRYARAALVAAVPHIEAAIRQAIEAEIREQWPIVGTQQFMDGFNAGIFRAARVARGGSR
jgi:hypothetical protein